MCAFQAVYLATAPLSKLLVVITFQQPLERSGDLKSLPVRFRRTLSPIFRFGRRLLRTGGSCGRSRCRPKRFKCIHIELFNFRISRPLSICIVIFTRRATGAALGRVEESARNRSERSEGARGLGGIFQAGDHGKLPSVMCRE